MTKKDKKKTHQQRVVKWHNLPKVNLTCFILKAYGRAQSYDLSDMWISEKKNSPNSRILINIYRPHLISIVCNCSSWHSFSYWEPIHKLLLSMKYPPELGSYHSQNMITTLHSPSNCHRNQVNAAGQLMEPPQFLLIKQAALFSQCHCCHRINSWGAQHW